MVNLIDWYQILFFHWQWVQFIFMFRVIIFQFWFCFQTKFIYYSNYLLFIIIYLIIYYLFITLQNKPFTTFFSAFELFANKCNVPVHCRNLVGIDLQAQVMRTYVSKRKLCQWKLHCSNHDRYFHVPKLTAFSHVFPITKVFSTKVFSLCSAISHYEHEDGFE